MGEFVNLLQATNILTEPIILDIVIFFYSKYKVLLQFPARKNLNNKTSTKMKDNMLYIILFTDGSIVSF